MVTFTEVKPIGLSCWLGRSKWKGLCRLCIFDIRCIYGKMCIFHTGLRRSVGFARGIVWILTVESGPLRDGELCVEVHTDRRIRCTVRIWFSSLQCNHRVGVLLFAMDLHSAGFS